MRRTTTLGILGLVLISVAAAACRPSEAEVIDGVGVRADDDQSPRLRRVWAAAGDYSTPSPDGRLIAFVDWSTGDVAVHDIGTGESRRITDKGTWTENGSWAEWPIFSPDGTKVVYSYGNVLTGDPFRYELRYVELGDTTQHLVRAIDVKEDWIVPLDWSERGILFTHCTTPDECTLAILDPASGAVEMVERDFSEGRSARFSPDDRFVAYQVDKLEIRDLERGALASIDFPIRSLVDWSQDGLGLLVHGVHQGRSGLWIVPVREGRQAGEPRLVRDGVPFVNQGGGRAGDAFYYLIPADAPRVHLTSVDVAAGRMLTAPVAVTTPIDGGALLPTWSPDGRQLAYLLRPLNNQGPTRLMVREVDGDGLRELATLRLERIMNMAWTPDAREILAFERTGDVYSVSVEDGSVEKRLSDVGRFATFSPDGRTVAAMVIPRDERTGELVAIDVASGERRVLERFSGQMARNLSFSPDSRTLAYVSRAEGQGASEIRVISTRGGASRAVSRIEFPQHYELIDAGLAWTPDGRHLLLSRGEWEREESHDLWAVALDDGASRPLGIPTFPGTSPFRLNAAGDRLAYVAGEARSELWVLDRIDD